MMSKVIPIRYDAESIEAIDRVAKGQAVSRSQFIRDTSETIAVILDQSVPKETKRQGLENFVGALIEVDLP
jgi:hypothetical protein